MKIWKFIYPEGQGGHGSRCNNLFMVYWHPCYFIAIAIYVYRLASGNVINGIRKFHLIRPTMHSKIHYPTHYPTRRKNDNAKRNH